MWFFTKRESSIRNPVNKAPNRDFIFIHINKTGGTSITSALGIKKKQHLTAREIINIIGLVEYRRLYKFSVVRNPWAKVYSHYKYRVKTNQTDLKNDTIDFNHWVKESYGSQNPKYYDKPKFFAPQVEWLKDSEGVIDLDCIIKFEKLSDSFEAVKSELGINRGLPHLNSTIRSNYIEAYNSESIEVVGKVFEEDIAMFNYQFDHHK